MPFNFNVLLIAVCLFFPLHLAADEASSRSKAIKLALDNNLHNHKSWFQLLHYKGDTFSDGYTSEVKSKTFFISLNGQHSPQEELSATISAFFEPVNTANQHAICKFPARYQWLKQQHVPLPKQPACTEFAEWFTQHNYDQLSLVFASAYLENPASFYGHLLLKFSSSRNHTNLLDLTVNYGAAMTDTNPILYIINGLFGGYPAGFSDGKFYVQNHNYGQIDLRDLWEYELNLNTEQISFIAAHLWELMGQSFTYYFLDENCAYHFARLLETVVEQPLTDAHTPWVMPITVFQKLTEASLKDNTPLVKSVTHIPSREFVFNQEYNKLSYLLKKHFKSILAGENWAKELQKLKISENEQIQLINVLFNYIELALIKTEDNHSAALILKKHKNSLVIYRLQLPTINKQESSLTGEISTPDQSQFPKTVRTSINHSNAKTSLRLQLRPVYYDLISNPLGRMKNSSLSMLDMSIDISSDDISLYRLDVVSIEALNVNTTDLASKHKNAWKINFGIDSLNSHCSNCNRAQITGGIGKSYQLGSELVFNAMLIGSAHTQAQNEGNFTLRAELKLLAVDNQFWNSMLLYEALHNSDFTYNLTWQNSFFNTKTFDLRAAVGVHNKTIYSSIGLSYYF